MNSILGDGILGVSTVMVVPSSAPSICANTRATASVPEPAAKGRMKLMGRVGRHSLCACARAGAARLAASRLRRCKLMFLSLLAVHPQCPFLRWRRGWSQGRADWLVSSPWSNPSTGPKHRRKTSTTDKNCTRSASRT
jgi:hypothetical protein